MPEWKTQYEGVENMTLAVMGCVVNGPGESKAASIGISLPGTGEEPHCPVYIDGQHFTTLKGTYDELAVGLPRPRGRLHRDEVPPPGARSRHRHAGELNSQCAAGAQLLDEGGRRRGLLGDDRVDRGTRWPSGKTSYWGMLVRREEVRKRLRRAGLRSRRPSGREPP